MKKINRRTFKLIRNIVIVVILLLIALGILKLAPNYKNDEITNQTNLIINNKNITEGLKNKVLVKDDVIYLSKSDIKNFFDPYIYYETDTKRIITSYDTKVASLIIDDTNININGKIYNLSSPAIIYEDTTYLPFSLMETVYNADIKYIKNTDIVTVETLSREKITAQASKDVPVRSRIKVLSRTVEKVKKDETLVIISKLDDNWVKVRTENGKIGYVKTDDLKNETIAREAKENTKQITGKVNMVWDYYSEYVTAPNRSGTEIPGINVVSPSFFVLKEYGKGEILDKVGTDGIKYISWAKSNNYKVWAMLQNDGKIKTTSEIMNSYDFRSELIENIINLVNKYQLDGINIDFEYMYDKDIDLFTQFLVELYPRMKELDKVLSVDVTAPDGGENWSTCYNRNQIADNCDYIVFMAYDQFGGSSKTAGSTASFDWVETNLKKFLGREEISSEKIILAIPFYTRIWEEDYSGTLTKNNTDNIISMKNISKVIPNGVEKNWLDSAKQYYVEYKEDNLTYKMWIEDERSIKEKLSLINDNNLAGVAFWSKDRESDSIWNVIDEELN